MASLKELKKESPGANGAENVKTMQRYEKNTTESEIFDFVLSGIEKSSAFTNGNRNNFVHALAADCNRFGLNESFVTGECVQRYTTQDFTAKEITLVVRGAYERNRNEHGTKQYRHRATATPLQPQPKKATTQPQPQQDAPDLDVIITDATFTADTACEPPTSHNHQRQVAGNTRQLLTTDRQGQITQNVFNILAAGARYPDQQLT